MRILNVAGRLTIDVDGERGVDVETASRGRFGSDPQAIYESWDEFRDWASGDWSAADARAPSMSTATLSAHPPLSPGRSSPSG